MICCVLNADSDVGDDEDGVTAEAMMWLFVMRLFRMRCDCWLVVFIGMAWGILNLISCVSFWKLFARLVYKHVVLVCGMVWIGVVWCPY